MEREIGLKDVDGVKFVVWKECFLTMKCSLSYNESLDGGDEMNRCGEMSCWDESFDQNGSLGVNWQ